MSGRFDESDEQQSMMGRSKSSYKLPLCSNTLYKKSQIKTAREHIKKSESMLQVNSHNHNNPQADYNFFSQPLLKQLVGAPVAVTNRFHAKKNSGLSFIEQFQSTTDEGGGDDARYFQSHFTKLKTLPKLTYNTNSKQLSVLHNSENSTTHASVNQKDSVLIVAAFNCNHDHTKFSLLIPISLQFKNLDRANLTVDLTRYIT